MGEYKKFEFAYTIHESYKELDEGAVKVIEAAMEASEKAYSVYSSFKVGAAVLLDDETIFLGNNQENIAFPSGLCAERTVLFYIGANYPERKVKKLAIYAKGDLVNDTEPISPCGSCRQVIAEVIKRQKESFQLYLCGSNGKTIVMEDALGILPFPFGM